ncbi:MAG TPA: type II secretion system protein [Armatimonadota bacterium]|nr:type II secretion system protein [Armatimonadota bacterium]
MRSRHPGRPYRRGFTLTEIIIAIAVLALVMALLGLPLLSAFGYVQKATARGEAQRAGLRAAQQLERELAVAMYIFELPPDGTWVSYVKAYESATDIERSRGMAMGMDSGQLVLCRYAQLPAFPWVWEYAEASASTQSWVLLSPNYAAASAAPTYERYYAPFHDPNRQGQPENPYTVMQLTESGLSWASATVTALDARFPLSVETDAVRALGLDRQTARDQLLRRKQNCLFGVTPAGDVWDTPRFQVSPRRVTGESLHLLTASTGLSLPTVARAELPLIAGRSRDLDEIPDADLTTIYGENSATIRALFPLYPVGANPFGYQVRVFDGAGGLVYGVTGYSSATGSGRLATSRHFMDWPRIQRTGTLAYVDPTTNTVTDVVEDLATWNADDIARHRLEGTFVFEQPVAPKALIFSSYGAGDPYRLPIPEGWLAGLTYLVTPPRKMTLEQGGAIKTFRLVNKAPADLGQDEYCLAHPGSTFGDSRQLAFGEDMDGSWAVVYGTSARPSLYTLCDLQPTDTVVVTYSSKAVLDLALTVSRKDYAARTPETSRQDFSVTRGIEAKNAAKRARRDDR